MIICNFTTDSDFSLYFSPKPHGTTEKRIVTSDDTLEISMEATAARP